MKLNNTFILFVILLVATVLRFWNYFSVPLTYDEFSALFRTQFSNFNELIEKGVKVDGHPAAIQIFLFYWVKIVGFNNWLVKLPFALMGLGSIYFIFRIGKAWHNETVGLLVAALVSTIQFHVMYSQIARPYISGLFFSMVMVFYWTQLIKEPQVTWIRNGILYVLSASLCAYNHHFSLLFAALVWLSGLFFLNRKLVGKYLLAGFLIFILYIPHLPIFFYQLSIGGVEGWLGKPEPEFLITFIQYLLNYSLLSLIPIICLVIWGIFTTKTKFFRMRYFLLSLSWFLIPFSIAYYYSIYVNSVLQFSVLIFSFPFLFLVLFGHIPLQSAKVNLGLVILILAVNTFSLVKERRHYQMFYQSPHEQLVTDFKKVTESKPNTLSIIDLDADITRYYLKEQALDSNFIWFQSFTKESDFVNFLAKQSQQCETLYFGCLSNNNPMTVPIIKDFYPTLVWQKNYAGGTGYFFSKKEPSEMAFISKVDFETNRVDYFSPFSIEKFVDSIRFSGNKSYAIDSLTEWSPVFSRPLDEIIRNENNFIDVSVKVLVENNFTDATLAASLESNDTSIYWGGTRFSKFIASDSSNAKWQTVHFSIKLSDINQNHANILLKVYIWNNQKQQFLIDDFTIQLRNGNPIIYGLLEKI